MEFRHELVVPNEDLPFKLFIFEGQEGSYAVDKHWHRSVEIFSVFEGEIEFSINDRKYYLDSGAFVLVNSNEIHSIKAPSKNLTIVLQIPLQVFENYFTEERFILFSHQERNQDGQIKTLIEAMYQTYYERACGYELKVQSQFFMLIYLLVTKYRKREVSADVIRHNKRLNRLSTITTYIKENYQKELSLESIAKVFGYSPTYLSKMFRKYARTNYKTYLQNVRLVHAYQELTNTENTLSDIAANNGFPNSKAFAKAFKNKYKILPSMYRKLEKGQESDLD